MEEFKKKKPKVPVTIKVKEQVIKDARKKNLNVSAVCQYALELAVKGKLIPPSKKGA